ncbi:MAG: calcium/sodium antiporter, partial [Chloroflexi bacterium]|nr:calcium/sodium antiporter [Chloroflexota bacterium]
AFGTSAPEAAVTVQAALAGQADVAVGNVVGSNIFNVLFILGLAALVAPLVVAQQLVRLDVPIMLGASVLVMVMAQDGAISRSDGAVLLGVVAAYTVFAVRESRRESAAIADEYAREYGAAAGSRLWLVDLATVVVGLGLLVLGARWLVDGAVALARAVGMSELVIGLTIVAAGTSLPEVATSIIASLRGERDIAVGNVVGSNIFNLLGVLGLSSAIAAEGLSVAPAVLRFDLPVMLAVAAACLPIFFTGHRIDRWEGGLFLTYYTVYVLYVVLDATGHDALPALSAAMLGFVLPLTVVTLLVLFVHAARRGGERT